MGLALPWAVISGPVRKERAGSAQGGRRGCARRILCDPGPLAAGHFIKIEEDLKEVGRQQVIDYM